MNVYSSLFLLVLSVPSWAQDVPFYLRKTQANQDLGAINQNFSDQTVRNACKTTTQITPSSCPSGQTLTGACYHNGYTYGGVCLSVSGSTFPVISGSTGPAGGDLKGNYPNPTLKEDRVRIAGDTMTGYLNVNGNANLLGGTVMNVPAKVYDTYGYPKLEFSSLSTSAYISANLSGVEDGFEFLSTEWTGALHKLAANGSAPSYVVYSPGNFGVGNPFPQYKLDVSSWIHAAGGIVIDQDSVVMGSSTASGFFGDGYNLTDLDASKVTNGTLDDARLTPNVDLLNATQTVSGFKTFTSGIEVDTVTTSTGIVVLGGISAAFLNGTLDASNLPDKSIDSSKLSDTGVAAGTYGDATNIPQITVDSTGRLTAVTPIVISVVDSQAIADSTASLQAQINDLNITTATIADSTTSLQLQINDINLTTSTIADSTTSLQLQINDLNTTTGYIAISTAELVLRLDYLDLSTAALSASTESLQGQIDALPPVVDYGPRLDELGVSTTALSASTVSLQGQIDALPSPINYGPRLDELGVSTTSLSVSTVSLQNQINALNLSTYALSASTISLANVDATLTVATTALSVSTASLYSLVTNLPGSYIQDGTIQTAKLATDSVTSVKILNGSVQTSKLASDAVTNSAILDYTIKPIKLYLGLNGIITGGAGSGAGGQSVDTSAVGDAIVSATGIAIKTGAVSTTKIATDAVTSTKILSGAVQTDKLATDAVTSDKIINGAIQTAKLATDAVTYNSVLNGGLRARNMLLLSGGVLIGGSDGIGINGSFSAGDVTETAVTPLGAITLSIGNNKVDTAKINTDAVTSDKIISGAVQTSKLATDAVTTTAILNGAVTSAKTTGSSLSCGANQYPKNSTWTNGLLTSIGSCDTPGGGGGGDVVLKATQTFSGSNTFASPGVATTTFQTYNVFQGSADVQTGSWTFQANSTVTFNGDTSFPTGITTISSGSFSTLNSNNLSVNNSLYANYTADYSIISASGIKINNGGITADFVDANLNGSRIVANTIDTTKLAPDAVNTTAILNQAVTAAKMVNGGVFTGDASTTFPALTINAGAINTGKLATDAVTASKILNGSIQTSKLATDSVTNLSVLDQSINVYKLAASGASSTQCLVFNGSYWAPSACGTASIIWVTDTFTPNGITKQFSLSYSPLTNSVKTFLSGFSPRTTSDWTLSGTTLSFSTAPANGTILDITYMYSGPSSGNFALDSFNPNSNTTVFNLSHTPISGSARAFLSGLSPRNTSDWILSGTSVSFATAPANGTILDVGYMY